MKSEPEARGARAGGSRRAPKVKPEGWQPFGNAPQKVQRYFRGRLARAHKEPQAAIQLFCIECMGYNAQEAAKCACLTCPLYAFNRRIFS